jgi:hypothetical protein
MHSLVERRQELREAWIDRDPCRRIGHRGARRLARGAAGLYPNRMSPHRTVRHATLYPSIAASLLAILAVAATSRAGESGLAAGESEASLLGGALPGGAVISARYASVTSVSGGASVTTPIAADGSFRFGKLTPGEYRLALLSGSVPKQTQGATFGEKVNAGLQAPGSAVSQGATAARHDTAKNSVGNIRARAAAPSPAPASDTSAPSQATQRDNVNNGMPNRISMNVSIAKRSRTVEIDGAPVEVHVDADGTLAGRAYPGQ